MIENAELLRRYTEERTEAALKAFRETRNGMTVDPASLDELRPYLQGEGLDEEHLRLLIEPSRRRAQGE